MDGTSDCRGKQQITRAVELCLAADIIVPLTGCGRNEVERFQEYLAREEKAAIVIYSYEQGRKPTIYYDGREHMRQQMIRVKYTLCIVYYITENHYEPIKLLHRFLCYKYFCQPCDVGYQRIENHLKCPHRCPRCLRSPRCREQESIICQTCHHKFLSRDCYNHHLLPNSFSAQYSVCQSFIWCPNCSLTLTRNVAHQCGMSYCPACNKVQDKDHQCSITPKPKKRGKSKKVAAFLYYDFEARQDVEVQDGGKVLKVHVPNYYVAHLICQRCANLPDDDICDPTTRSPTARSPCHFCIIREFKYHGDDAVKNFVDLTLTFRKCYSTVVCIAHNAKGYDAQFLIREFLRCEKESISSLIITGTSINLMECGNLKFIDSLNYMQMPLASLPKAFGLGNINKGYFPHFFNTTENQNYVGAMPPKETFGIRASSLKDQEAFDAWYKQKVDEGYQFDLKKEMEYYCTMDVIILRRASTMFQSMIIKVGNVCPFTECVTIASTCLLIFRRNFLKEGDIAILHRNGYRLADNQSRVAIEWLLWLEHSQNIKIKHAGRSREYALNKLKLDGYRSENGVQYAYQFHGCYWHGCKRCFKTKRDVPLKDGTTFDSRLINTERLSEEIRLRGFHLIEIWECEFDEQKKTNIQMQNYLSSIDAQFFTPLDPRDAFFGGRTGNTVTHYDVQDGEQIHYDDFCSLYPYVLKTKPYPLGHPELYLWDQIDQICPNNDISNVDGLIKCRVLPPRNLFHAVLPVRAHGKLYFPLCRTCLENLVQTDCPHDNPAERELLGTWVASELRVAVAMGYRILAINEIWKFETTVYDPVTKTGGLFAEYINTFLKIKQEASGWPVECVDDESKTRYIDEYERVEGIRLDPEKIEKNPGLRAVAKLCLNCLWGKFGQRDNLHKHTIVESVEKFDEIVHNPQNEISSIIEIDQETIIVAWRNIKEAVDVSTETNVVVAAVTTAHTREKLYSCLQEKNDKVLYCDTDSVIYVSTGPDDQLHRGNFLGDLTDELEGYGVGSYIKSFVSGGPKFYSYLVQKPDGSTVECCKIKGVRLNYENRGEINYNSIRELVVDKRPAFQISFDGIRRTKTHQVITREESKTIQVTGPKRRFVEGSTTTTVPFGYKQLQHFRI